jgi:NAD(P)-dependent dehydrogenase (short-subunit alcohol dehydrogenase family)
METILVIGSTGNIGVSAVTAALRSNRNVLAVVRNQESADRLLKNVTSSGIIRVAEVEQRITFTEADVLSDVGVKGVVDRVRAGELPDFQHVWASGELYKSPTQ